MIINELEIIHLKIPLRRPFVTSFGSFPERNLVILKADTDQGILYSEAPSLVGPFYTAETTQTTLHILKDFICPTILNKKFTDIKEIHKSLGFIKGNNIAKSAIDLLFYQWESLVLKKSLKEIIGGTIDSIPTGISIGIQENIEQLLEIIDESIKNGYKKIR